MQGIGRTEQPCYTMRFKIEFNFRDAKQYWGLEDFMNTKETAVTNAVNLAFFMVNFSSVWLCCMNIFGPTGPVF